VGLSVSETHIASQIGERTDQKDCLAGYGNDYFLCSNQVRHAGNQ